MKNIVEIKKLLLVIYTNVGNLSIIKKDIYLDYNNYILKLETELKQDLGKYKITESDLGQLVNGGGVFHNKLTGEIQERPIKKGDFYIKKEKFLIKLEGILLFLEKNEQLNKKPIGFDLN